MYRISILPYHRILYKYFWACQQKFFADTPLWIAPVSTMRSDFARKYCMIYQICSVGNSCEALIENLFYTGAYILAGVPKIGKSFLVVQIAHHVSTGQDLWGYKTHQGTVLYLALED